MPILNNIPRKNVIIPTGGDRSFDRSRVQHVPVGFDGLSYNSPFTSDPFTNASHHNVATIAQIGAMQVEQPGIVVPAFTFVRVHPSNKTILNRAGKVIPIVKRQFGPGPNSDTPFHPKRVLHAPRPTRHASLTTEVYAAGDAVARGTFRKYPFEGEQVKPVGSFTTHVAQTLAGHAHADKKLSRWDTIKRGAAEQ